MVLARLGWTIVRIRSSVYHLDPKSSVRRLIKRLKLAGIEPLSDAPEGAVQASEGEELRARVIRSAEKIRKRWSESGGGDPMRRARGSGTK